MAIVPNVELFVGSAVVSRTRFGGSDVATVLSSTTIGSTEFRITGLLRFSGPGAPRADPTEPPNVPAVVERNHKSVALSLASAGIPPASRRSRVYWPSVVPIGG